VHELPREFRARAQSERPDLLEARWEAFAKPLNAALQKVAT
jgi:hypothetical protein